MQRARLPVPRCYVGDAAAIVHVEARAAVVPRLEVWRRPALRWGPEAPAAAAEPIKLLRGWLSHWAVEAVVCRHAWCGSSRLLVAGRWWRRR